MPNILTLTASNPDQLLNAGAYGAGAVIQVQGGALQAGPFTDDGQTPILAGTTSYTYYDTEGTTSTWYRTRYENAAGTTVSEWSTAFQPRTSLVLLADAQARSGDSITQAVIDGVEAELAGEIGPLTGERTETFYLDRLYRAWDIDGVYLSRRTDSISVATDGVTLVNGTDYRLIGGYIVDLIDTGWHGDELVVTYTPTDEGLVKEFIYDVLTASTIPVGMQSVRIGQYSETYFPGQSNPVWSAGLARIVPGAGIGLTSPFRFGRHSLHRSFITP